jgi:uncharacterized protein YlxP (DUF503 family)
VTVLVVRLSLRLPGCASLKEKRRRVRGSIERARALGLAVAEVGDQDLWGNAEVGLVAIGDEELLRRGVALFEEHSELEVVGIEREELRL